VPAASPTVTATLIIHPNRSRPRMPGAARRGGGAGGHARQAPCLSVGCAQHRPRSARAVANARRRAAGFGEPGRSSARPRIPRPMSCRGGYRRKESSREPTSLSPRAEVALPSWRRL